MGGNTELNLSLSQAELWGASGEGGGRGVGAGLVVEEKDEEEEEGGWRTVMWTLWAR